MVTHFTSVIMCDSGTNFVELDQKTLCNEENIDFTIFAFRIIYCHFGLFCDTIE